MEFSRRADLSLLGERALRNQWRAQQTEKAVDTATPGRLSFTQPTSLANRPNVLRYGDLPDSKYPLSNSIHGQKDVERKVPAGTQNLEGGTTLSRMPGTQKSRLSPEPEKTEDDSWRSFTKGKKGKKGVEQPWFRGDKSQDGEQKTTKNEWRRDRRARRKAEASLPPSSYRGPSAAIPERPPNNRKSVSYDLPKYSVEVNSAVPKAAETKKYYKHPEGKCRVCDTYGKHIDVPKGTPVPASPTSARLPSVAEDYVTSQTSQGQPRIRRTSSNRGSRPTSMYAPTTSGVLYETKPLPSPFPLESPSYAPTPWHVPPTPLVVQYAPLTPVTYAQYPVTTELLSRRLPAASPVERYEAKAEAYQRKRDTSDVRDLQSRILIAKALRKVPRAQPLDVLSETNSIPTDSTQRITIQSKGINISVAGKGRSSDKEYSRSRVGRAPSIASRTSKTNIPQMLGQRRAAYPTTDHNVMFIACTISEDRTGNQEGITRKRLAALGARGVCRMSKPQAEELLITKSENRVIGLKNDQDT